MTTIHKTTLLLAAIFALAGSGLLAQAQWDVKSGVTGRKGHASVTFNGRIWIIGGQCYGQNFQNDVWSSANGTDWDLETADAPWSPRSEHAAVVYNNRIWVIGGAGPNVEFNDVWSSTDGVNWNQETSAAAWTARSMHTVTVYNGEMWLLGGHEGMGYLGTYHKDVWTSSDGINWTQQADASWAGRAEHAATVLNNKLYVMGGSMGFYYCSDVWSFDGSYWTQCTATAWPGGLDDTITGATVLTYNGELWLIGGDEGLGPYSSVHATSEVWSSPDGVTWTQVTNGYGWAPRTGHSAVVFNGAMWIMGGIANGWNGGIFGTAQLGEEVNDVWSSMDGIIWSAATLDGGFSGFSGRTGHTTEVFANKLWVLGGRSALSTGGFSNNEDVWSTTDGVNWNEETASAGWARRTGHTSCVFNNKLWVLGGFGGAYTAGFLNDVWSSTDGVNWNQQAITTQHWTARREHATVVFNNRIWVLGGEDATGYCSDVWSSTDGINWTLESSAPGWDARAEHTAVVFNNRIWVMGGQDGAEFFHDVWSSADGVNWTQETPNAQWAKRFSQASAVFGGRIWVSGGRAHLPALNTWGMDLSAVNEFKTTATGVPTGERGLVVSGANLSEDVVVTAPSHFELARVGGSFQAGPITLPVTSSALSPVMVRVRYKPSSAPTTSGYHAGDIVVSTGAATRRVAVSGELVSAAGSEIRVSGGVNAFPALAPSPEQTYTVEGENLTGNLDITAPTSYEIALVGGAFTTSLSLAPTNGIVAPTTIRVRYNRTNGARSGFVAHASAGADSVSLPVIEQNLLPFSRKQEVRDLWSSVDGVNWTREDAADWTPRIGHTLAGFGESLWVMGGGHIIYSGVTYGETMPFPAEVWSWDLPSVELASTSFSELENAGVLSATVTLNRAYAFDVNVDFATSNGTATAPDDYTAASGSVTLPAGQTSADIDITLIDDTLDEPDEDLQLVLTSATFASLGTSTTASLQIIDDDGEPNVKVAAATYTVDESQTFITVTVELTNTSGKDVTVDYATSDGTALAGYDYQSAAGTLFIGAGNLSTTVDVPLFDDSVYEGDETFTLTLSNAVNAGVSLVGSTLVTITDNDAVPVLGFQGPPPSLTEQAGTVNLVVELSNPSSQVITVDYATAQGTATEGSDYVGASGTITFQPGQLTQTVSVTILDDTEYEPAETFEMTLLNPVNASAGSGSITLTIQTDDAFIERDGSGGDGGNGCTSGSNNPAWLLLFAILTGATISLRRRQHKA